MNERLLNHPSQHEGITIPLIALAVVLSIFIHIAIIWWVKMKPQPIEKNTPPLTVRLEPLPGPAPSLDVPAPQPRPEPPVARAKPPSRLKKTTPPPISAPKPVNPPPAPMPEKTNPVLPKLPEATQPPPTTALPPLPPVATPSTAPALDFASMVAAKKKARGEQDPSPEPVGKQEDANAKATRIAKQNLASATAPAFGYDPSKSGGVFQIKTRELTFASFVFNGWFNEARRNAAQLFEVRLGDNSSIELAVVRQMIQIIRQHEKGDFKWNNPQKGRTTTLSAREKDTETLEKFLLNEFF